MEPQQLAHMIDGLLEQDEIQTVLHRARRKLERTDRLEIDSLVHSLRTYFGWTEGDALSFLYKLGVAHLQLEA